MRLFELFEKQTFDPDRPNVFDLTGVLGIKDRDERRAVAIADVRDLAAQADAIGAKFEPMPGIRGNVRITVRFFDDAGDASVEDQTDAVSIDVAPQHAEEAVLEILNKVLAAERVRNFYSSIGVLLKSRNRQYRSGYSPKYERGFNIYVDYIKT